VSHDPHHVRRLSRRLAWRAGPVLAALRAAGPPARMAPSPAEPTKTLAETTGPPCPRNSVCRTWPWPEKSTKSVEFRVASGRPSLRPHTAIHVVPRGRPARRLRRRREPTPGPRGRPEDVGSTSKTLDQI
jgi:hypothetical protein